MTRTLSTAFKPKKLPDGKVEPLTYSSLTVYPFIAFALQLLNSTKTMTFMLPAFDQRARRE